MMVAPITATALKSAPERYAGIASGVNSTVSRLGSLMAVAVIGLVIGLVFDANTDAPDAVPLAVDQTAPELRLASVDGFRAGMAVAAALAFAGAAVGAFGISNREARGERRASRHRPGAGASRKLSAGGALAHARERLGARLPEAGEDGEPVALGVVDALLGEAEPRPDEDLQIGLGLRHGLDERVLEGAERIADGDSVRRAARPPRILAERELEERVVARAAVQSQEERRELRGDAPVHLDDLRGPRGRDEELHVEKAVLEPEAGHHPHGHVGRARRGAPAAARSGRRSSRSSGSPRT